MVDLGHHRKERLVGSYFVRLMFDVMLAFDAQ